MVEEWRRGAEKMGEKASAARESVGDRASLAREAMNDRAAAAREVVSDRTAAAKEAVEERATAAKEVTAEAIALVKPRLRGVSHEWAFFVSLFFGAGLILLASTPKATLAVAIYAVSLSALFGTSALYHRVDWKRPNVRRWMRRLDHSMIFFLIAGTYTPFALLALHGTLATAILVVVWAGAIAGAIVEMIWIDHPKWASVLIYMALSWVAVICFPALWRRDGKDPQGTADPFRARSCRGRQSHRQDQAALRRPSCVRAVTPSSRPISSTILPSRRRRTVVPVKCIFRPVAAESEPTRKSPNAGPLCVPPPSHWPTT